MALKQDHSALLDQLQGQVNLVLEHTGRLFAAAHANPKVPPVAQASRLRHALPSAMNRFHTALDALEDELQLAKTVMRRDLAVWREQTGQQVPEAPMLLEDDAPRDSISLQPPTEDSVIEVDKDSANGKPAGDDDTAMLDVSDQPNGNPTEISTDVTMENDSSDQKPESGEANETETIDRSIATNPLQLDTQTGTEPEDQKTSDDKQLPDTTDVDSLFNDPLSAGGAGSGNNGSPNNPNDSANDSMNDNNATSSFNFEDHVNASDFDLDSFSANLDADPADNNSLSVLLPGLQDYANTQPSGSGSVGGGNGGGSGGGGGGGDVDFNALFGGMDDGDGSGDMSNQNNDDPTSANPGHHDSTFDDLMDMANFDTDNNDPWEL